MGLNIRLYGINSPKAFTLSYKTGKTAGDESVIATGYTSYGSLYPASSSRNYTNDPIIFPDASFDTQYWFKLTYTGDTGDVNYVIENIFTNEAEVYDNCINYCYFPNAGSASFVPPPTPTPTPSSPPCDFSGGTATVVIGATPTPNPTATPTNTPTNTPTPTPTATTNVIVDPTYYYYAMGDCSDMRYSYTASTITGFSAPIQVPGCATLTEIGTLSLQNPATTTYNVSNPLDPCGFGSGYVGTTIARSSSGITEGTVYTIGSQCLSVVAVETQYVTGWTVNLDNYTAVGIGNAACTSCDPPFTGFTITGYSGVTCDTGANVIAYSLLGGFTIGNVYGIQMYSGGTATGSRICMTLNANLGPQFVIEDPETEGISGYQISDAGPATFPPTFSGYTNCTACNDVVQKYMITGDRCDTTGSVTIWSATAPTVVSGNTITVNIAGTLACFLVTQADQFTSVVYNDLGWTIADTGCDCNGDNGGGDINVANIDFTPSSFSDTGGECQSPQSSYYTETTSTQMQLTFKDSNNTQVTPNATVQYRVNGGTWTTLTVTSSTVSFNVTLIYGDNTNCSLGGSYADTLDIKVGTITVEYYVAGSS